MKIILAALLIVVTYAVPTKESRSGIVGGDDAVLGEFPYQILLKRAGRFICGGFIIDSNVVLTAAHCVKYTFFEYTVTAGIVDRINLGPYNQTVKVSQIFVHENYTSGIYANDIALLKLEKHLDYNEYVHASELSSPGQEMRGNCTATGWGRLGENEASSRYLQKVTMPVITDQECSNLYGPIPDKTVCTSLENGGKSPCNGDSGGPLICRGIVGGLTVGGERCAQPDIPAFYTEISYFNDWIKDKLAQ